MDVVLLYILLLLYAKYILLLSLWFSIINDGILAPLPLWQI